MAKKLVVSVIYWGAIGLVILYLTKMNWPMILTILVLASLPYVLIMRKDNVLMEMVDFIVKSVFLLACGIALLWSIDSCEKDKQRAYRKREAEFNSHIYNMMRQSDRDNMLEEEHRIKKEEHQQWEQEQRRKR